MGSEAILLGAAMMGSLVLYALFGGADFGGGVWHLLAGGGPRAARRRALIAEAIAPVWEANHVWLILVVVVLFTGFPTAFAEISTRLHAPLLALLLAIVARGAAFAFRSATGDRPMEERRFGAAFAVASVAAPVLLGMIVGALASGRLLPVTGDAPAPSLSWRGPWLSPFAVSTGLFTLALFSFLAAVYLTVDASRDAGTDAARAELEEDFRRRAIASGVLCGALALATFLLAGEGAPLVRRGLTARGWSWPLHAATAVAALTALGALVRRRFRLARLAAASQVALVVLGWGASQYPFIITPAVTLQSASAPAATQRLLLLALAIGAIVLFPSLRLLLRVFKSDRVTPP
jgi:cytochrome d ubiquinol oxidase subunit II